ncbi:MAG: EscU/YscU/HrcU family type III secretion system export apparatus switch protein [Burkholderiaceae bacterium]|nr:EscU/YscU/HrcU family type III secretion system export apparatus switch protein [Burkholderiaceae bacterium]
MADNDVSREDRQLPASERRLQKAREEGRVARSRDFGHFAMLGGALLAAAALGPGLAQASIEMVRGAMRFGRPATLAAENVPQLFASIGFDAFVSLLPFLGALALSAIAASAIPGGIVLSGKPLSMDISKLSPRNGLKRIFSIRGSVELLKLIVLAVALLAVSAWFVAASLPEFAELAGHPLAQSLGSGASLMGAGMTTLLAVLALVALVDLPFQWFRHRADLRMTFQEAKQEAKESDGDPMLRSRIRARQREIASRRMLAAVPAADVVVTNPTHYAVAIRYDEAKGGAPRVVAKGADLLAGRIREIARGSSVPLVEAPPLARALYAHVELDREIPLALYNAVAQVLAYVYQLRNWVPGRGAAPRMPDTFEVPDSLDPAAAPAGDPQGETP